MYKIASRNRQHAHRVDRMLPTGGYIGDGAAAEDDLIATADNLNIAECKAELGRLSVEMARVNNQLAAAKAVGDKAEARRLGLLLQTFARRRTPYKQRIHILSMAVGRDALAQACKELLPSDLLEAVWKRTDELREQHLLSEGVSNG